MSWFGRRRHPNEVPQDSPDLAFTMSFVCGVGAISAWRTRGSHLGLLTGAAVSACFGLGGYWITSSSAEKHEFAHQMCLLASMMFSGAMGYRAGSNVYSGPGGTMLAALGGVSAAYHLTKFMEWRNFEMSRIVEAERVLHDWDLQRQAPPPQPAQPAPFPPTRQARGAAPARRDAGTEPLPLPFFGSVMQQRQPPQLQRRTPVPPGGF